ncbi:MAG: hypothetical protein ACHQ7M_05660 [Chloroflexota bacterium]|jgi:hypothetical protein
MTSTNDSIDQEQKALGHTSRRALMRTVAKLAVVTPLALAVLPGVASAKDHGDGDGDDQGGDRDGHGRGRALGLNCAPNANVGQQFNGARSALPLVGVGSVNGGAGGGDFTATSPGSDGLSAGEVFVNDAKQVFVALRGAMANAGYDVQFVRLHDDGREDLGTITTDTNGAFNGTAPNALGGGNRAGAFVLIRSGSDEYVTTWP